MYFFQDKDISLSGEHVREGLTCVVSVRVKNPEFEGQTKVLYLFQKFCKFKILILMSLPGYTAIICVFPCIMCLYFMSIPKRQGWEILKCEK